MWDVSFLAYQPPHRDVNRRTVVPHGLGIAGGPPRAVLEPQQRLRPDPFNRPFGNAAVGVGCHCLGVGINHLKFQR